MTTTHSFRPFTWFIPTWNGDMRLAPSPADSSKTLMTVEKPTVDEQSVINAIASALFDKGWFDKDQIDFQHGLSLVKWDCEINAPLEKVSPVVASIMRPGPAVLSAILLADGKIVTCTGTEAELAKTVADVADQAKADPKKEPKAAATVRRPTPCCPLCFASEDATKPATEVLLSFLSEAQHETWARKRAIVVTGNLSGHRYILSHRNAEIAVRCGRICYDLDSETVLHFHAWDVPAEEEVLAAMLILEHEEPWLRNEATLFHRDASEYFKNPFGDITDGAGDSGFTMGVGLGLQALLGIGAS